MSISKQQLYNACLDYVQTRINNASKAIQEAQEASNSETKSTAGDKHDTARAMMQLEVEKNAKQLAEAQKLKRALSQINADKICEEVEIGAMVETSRGNFFVAISAGKVDGNYFAISPVSPIGQLLTGLKEGDRRTFNGNEFKILAVN